MKCNSQSSDSITKGCYVITIVSLFQINNFTIRGSIFEERQKYTGSVMVSEVRQGGDEAVLVRVHGCGQAVELSHALLLLGQGVAGVLQNCNCVFCVVCFFLYWCLRRVIGGFVNEMEHGGV